MTSAVGTRRASGAALVACLVTCAPQARPDAHGAPVVPGASHPASATAADAGAPCTFVARFEPPSHPLSASGPASLVLVVRNRSASAARLDLDTAGSAILGVAFFDARGERVLTVPPGVPPDPYVPRTETLAPGASHRFDVELHVFSPDLAPGSYTARSTLADACAEPVRFVVAR